MNFLSITWDPSLGIDLGFFTIRWYSLMFVAAFIFGLRIMKKIYIEDKISIENTHLVYDDKSTKILIDAKGQKYICGNPNQQKPITISIG